LLALLARFSHLIRHFPQTAAPAALPEFSRQKVTQPGARSVQLIVLFPRRAEES